jgi:hypothetical protein
MLPYYGVGRIAVVGTFEVGIDRRLHVRQRAGEDGELYVVAGPDPTILVADEVLHQIVHHSEQVHPGVSMMWAAAHPVCQATGCCQNLGFLALPGNNCFYGALLTFDTQQGRIIYRIGTYDLERHGWLARWPD